ncbi:hypothetical protein HPB47_005242, partial [Ixodes persulcatus]
PAAKETGWADRVKGSPTQVTRGTPPEQHNTIIVQLERENAALKGAIKQLRSEMAELRSALKCEASQPSQAPKLAREETPMEARTAKKRAVAKPVRHEGLEEFQTEMRVMLKSLSEAVAMLNAKVDVLDGKFNALEARVGTLEARRGTMEFCAIANNEPSPTGNPATFRAQHLQAATPYSSKVEHSIVEIIPSGRLKCSIFILHIYNSPKDLKQRFAPLFSRAAGKAGGSPLIVAGDFNAPHRAYLAFPTRIGNSCSRDTTPDLTFVENVGAVYWHTLNEDLGSDHNILATRINVKSKPLKEFTITDWDKFRESREERALIQDSSIDLERWPTQLKGDVKTATKTVQTDLEIDRMDSRLAYLLEAKKALLDRLKGQRLNRRLRKKIAELNRTIEDHCKSLTRQQRDEVCNSVDGQMRVGGKWNLLKHLHTSPTLTPIRARLSETEDAILDALTNRYLPIGTSSHADYPSYKGPPCLELNEPFTVNEISEVLQNLNGRSAPGPNGISNRALRNLEDGTFQFLTDEINRIWEQGSPGRPPGLANLRPISLTSCVSKVAEHVIHNRISRHIKGKNLFPYNMIGFRPDVRAILGLDLEKAFDNITHAHILDSISELGLGDTFHKFVSSFLRSRKATLKIGDLKSGPVELGPKGTPQGAVISPLLFNIAMCKLSKQLSTVEGINHTLYADDITIWCVGGSVGEVETALQEALDQTEHFLTNTGLKCSSSKSELLLHRPVRRGPKPKGWMPLSEVDITIRTSTGNTIPRVDVLRVLGMPIESNGSNIRTINKITTKTENMIRLINRVSNRRGGLKEDNLLRLFHAFLMSHIKYVAAMHCWHGHEKKIDTLIRKSIKRVLGIPMQASTERLMQLGVHNTLEEIIEAQETAQHNVGRRRARAIALLRHVRDEPRWACFVDAAQYGRSARFAAVAIGHKGSIVNSESFKDSTPSRAEQAAIALALLDDTGKDAGLQNGYGEFKDILFTFNEVTKHYQMDRRTFPPPHGKLSSSAITSSELLTQLRAVQRAHDAAVRLGLPVPTWVRGAALRAALLRTSIKFFVCLFAISDWNSLLR